MLRVHIVYFGNATNIGDKVELLSISQTYVIFMYILNLNSFYLKQC